MTRHEGEAVDGRRRRGARTRSAILARAAEIGSVEGLEGISIGRLATELGVSKAGVFAHFGSKEQLQLSTVRSAATRFAEAVFHPVGDSAAGLERLWRLCDSWLSYAERRVFPGGCFFLHTAAEFDARPGPIRDELADLRRAWLDVYQAEIRTAVQLGQIRDVDPMSLAFELDALGMSAALHEQLCGDAESYGWARAAMGKRLAAIATSAGARVLERITTDDPS